MKVTRPNQSALKRVHVEVADYDRASVPKLGFRCSDLPSKFAALI